MDEVRISDIVIGKRHRKDIGNIEELAESIKTIGLLHPIVLQPNRTLIVGERRLAAFKHLGRDTIPARVVHSITELKSLVDAECQENTCRKDFTPEEAVAIGSRIEEIAREEAKKRQQTGKSADGMAGGRGNKKPYANFAEGLLQEQPMRLVSHEERMEELAFKKRIKEVPLPKKPMENVATVIAAKAVGMSRPTYERAKAVVAAAKQEPEKNARFLDQMNKTGKVSGVFKQLAKSKQVEQIQAEPPPMPEGPFRVLVIDPPWKYDNRENDESHRAANPYPSMSIEQIKAMKIQPLAHEHCVLWLWITNSHIMHGWDILSAWGFEYKTMLTWAKDRMGTGDWLRGRTEHCLLAIRGKPVLDLTNQTTLLNGALREHSRKPEEFYQMVDSLCPGSKCELFSRTPRTGWAAHGNDVSKFTGE